MTQQTNNTANSSKKDRKYRWFRRLVRTIIFILIFLLLLLGFLRSPWGQDLIIQRAVTYVEGKTGTEVAVDRLFITFDGNVKVEGVYLEDERGDTLIYSKYLEANLPLRSLLSGGAISIDDVEWDGLKARIKRSDSLSGFNFEFLQKAFATSTDTSSTEPLQIDIGAVHLSNFQILYDDQVTGVRAVTGFKNLDLTMEQFDIERMRYALGQFELQDAEIDLMINSPESNVKNQDQSIVTDADQLDAAQRLLPLLSAESIRIERVGLNYKSQQDGLELKSYIRELSTSIEKADLQKQIYEVTRFELNQSQFMISQNASDDATDFNKSVDVPFHFEWPALDVDLHDINLTDNHFEYRRNGAITTLNEFNPNAIDITDFNLSSSRISLGDESLNIVIEDLSGNEASGIQLKTLQLDSQFNNKKIDFKTFSLQLNQSLVQGNLRLDYDTINTLFKDPEKVRVTANVPVFQFDINDVFLFSPELRENEYLKPLSSRTLGGNLIAMGATQELKIPKVSLRWGTHTSLDGSAILYDITDLEKLSYDLSDMLVVSNRSDMSVFVNESELGVVLPEELKLSGSLQGTTIDVSTDVKLSSTLGDIEVIGAFDFGDLLAFDATINANHIDLAQILKNPALGDLAIQVSVKGSGDSINTLNADLSSTITRLSYNEYPLKDLKIQGSFQNGKGEFKSQYKDDHLNIDLASQVQLDTINNLAQLDIDIKGANLAALGLTKQDVRAAGSIHARFKGTTTNYELQTDIQDGIAVYDEQSYLLGKLAVNAFVKPDTTSMDISNQMIDLNLKSNSDPSQLFAALQRHVNRYLTDEKPTDLHTDVTMQLKGTLSPSPLLREVILPQLESLDTIQIAVDFNENKRRLQSDVIIPYVKYAGSEMDSLLWTTRSDKGRFDFQFGFNQLSSGPILLKKTFITAQVKDQILSLEFSSWDDKEKLIHVLSKLSRKRDETGAEHLVLSLSNDDFILNKQTWSISYENKIIFKEEGMRFNRFKLMKDSQSVSLSNEMSDSQNEQVLLKLTDFKLQNLLSYLNPDEKIATGTVDGTLNFEEVMGSLGLVANLNIKDLHVLKTPLGELALNAESVANAQYDVLIDLKGKDVDLGIDGSYNLTTENPSFDLDLSLQRLNMTTLAALSQDALKEGSGYLMGELKLSGTTNNPKYEGSLSFKDASIKVALLNNTFNLKNERIELSNDLISLKDVEIRDQTGNIFAVDGTIGTADVLTPTFDLKLDAQNFTALNSTEQDSELYYGQVKFDAYATITGDLDIPVIDMSIEVDEATDLTYVLTAEEVEMVEREGIVQFVNKQQPDAILTQTEEESAVLKGFDIKTAFKINQGAQLTIIVDPTTGDRLQVSGAGDLRLEMIPNGRMTLTGRYQINDGFYELNFYDIVSRRFELAPGGSVSWSGDPFDANLDVRAIYKVEANASALMASQTSGVDIATKNRFGQKLPFLVYLNIDGALMSPEISFKLDLPEDEQGAVGGQIYGRLQQLNGQEEELNKQVFSLLTFNRFFPTTGSDGSSGGSVTIARDNLNQALSDQLNQYGDKLLGNTGVELDIGLDSYTDYQGASPQDRTQLDVTASKKLLDDRLIISVGSEVDIQGSNPNGEATPIIGNVSLEYILTDSGQWRIKGFRKNQFDNVVDGQLVVSGISLIFTKEFNQFKNLFKNTVQQKQNEARKEGEEGNTGPVDQPTSTTNKD